MTFRRNRIVAAAVLFILEWVGVGSALAHKSYDFDLPEQSLAESLRQIARRATMNILFDAGSVEKMTAPAIKGVMSAEKALETVLTDTGFVIKEVGRDSVLIAPRKKVRRPRTTRRNPDRIGLPAAQSGRESETAPLEEVTVTAQRREENSQSVPITIDAVSGEEAALRGAVSVQTISAAVPNLTTAGTFWSNTFVRGVGTNSASPNNEPSVATYVDGVYSPSSYALSSLFFNHIERLEVLKGPQGTLFGRNATGGVIQIITSDPDHEFGGNVSLGYANYETIQASAYLTRGITDDLAADVAVIFENQAAGWGDNPTYRTEIFTHENFAARSKWLYTPSDSTQVSVALDYSTLNSDGANNQLLPGSFAIDGVTTYPGKHNAVGEVNVNDNEHYGASARIEHDFGALHGVSITSYRNVSGRWHTDNDNTPNRWTTIDNYSDGDYVTQELQLSNLGRGSIGWLIGVFFYGNQVEVAPQARYGENVMPDGYSAAYGRQETRSVSAFGQATAEIVADTRLTVGLRYTAESLEAEGYRVDGTGQVFAGPFASEIEFDPWTWRIALDHQFAPDVLGYVSYNRGFKSGGYNLSSPGSIPFYPETVDAYEVGLKSEFLNNRVRLNLATFYYDYENLQVAIVPGGGSQIFTNAASARNYGLDASFDFAATDSLTLSMGVGLLDARYTDYPNAQGFTNRGIAVQIANARGRELPYAPPISGHVSADYRLPTTVGEFKVTMSLTYNDRSFISPTETPVRPSYELLNCSVEWWSPSAAAFGVRLWGKNLTNSYYPVNLISSSGGWYGSYAAPRTYGLTLLAKF